MDKHTKTSKLHSTQSPSQSLSRTRFGRVRGQKPHLSFWQIWNMSFGFLGIQFGFALQNANVSRIFESLGADIGNIPFLWLAAPVTGLIVQPIIGHMSDKTWNKLGRRKPYFLFGAIFASIALILMPNSPALWVAAGMLWIMDASINISMEPFRAFVGDMLPSEQRTLGFSMQSFFIGIGAVAGSALPYVMSNWFGVSNIPQPGKALPDTVIWSFYIGAIVFISAVLVTILTTKEYSPEELASFADDKEEQIAKTVSKEILPEKFSRFGTLFGLLGLAIVAVVFFLEMDVQIYVLGGLFILVSVLFYIVSIFRKKEESNGLTEIMTDLMNMPRTMGQLAVVQFFTWIALFSLWIYATPAITEFHFGATDTKSALYNEGANWVGILFGAYSFFAAFVAFLLPVSAKFISRKYTHLVALIIGGLGLISLVLFKNPNMLIISMVGVGVAWASILSMPYAMLTGSLPADKMGTYMGIFNFFIVLPQILAATILGSITKHLFNGHAIYTLVLGGGFMILAGLLTLIVDDKDDPFFSK